MTFLPIVGRELRVAARKRSTFWVRIVAAIIALAIGVGMIILMSVSAAGSGSMMPGKWLFAALSWIALGVALAAGLFFTSDCLSEEKREGTLGFLFLTDLRGYDVVLGKLLATSLRGVCALLAAFPVMAVALLLGGLTGAEFWRTIVALLNAQFFSLATGMFVSAVSRESQKAMTATLCVLTLFVAGGPLLDSLRAALAPGASPMLSLSSPGYVFVAASTWGRSLFWPALCVNQIVAWALLVGSCVVLPRAWQQKANRPLTRAGRWEHWWKFGSARRIASLRRRLLEVNPVLWLACRERWQAALMWGMTLLIAVGYGVMFANEQYSLAWIGLGYFAGLPILLWYFAIASQSGRLLVEARRHGLLEILLVSPLDTPQIVQGQWRALVRMFGKPLALYLALQFLGTVMAQQQMWKAMAAAPPVAVPVVNSNGTTTVVTQSLVRASGATTAIGISFMSPHAAAALASAGGSALSMLANLVALAWFGMWMGMTSRNVNVATWKTLAFVQIIPWMVIGFASYLIAAVLLFPAMSSMGTSGSAGWILWFPLITTGITTVLTLAKDVVFMLWARKNLHAEFRARATETVPPVRTRKPPPLPQLIGRPTSPGR